MNDQNFYVMPNSDNNQPRPETPQVPIQNMQPRPVAPQATVQAAPTSPVMPTQPRVQQTVANSYEAPKAPQPSGATFDYNQLYGNKNVKVEEKQAFVFEEPEMETSATAITNEPTITISNDELIPEFDASVLEVLPEQEKKNIAANQATTAKVSNMASNKQVEEDKSRSNIIFIAILFGIIIAAVVFLFPIVVKM